MNSRAKLFLLKIAAAVGALAPLAAHAQTIQSIIASVYGVLDLLLPLAVSIALLVFVWGIIRYVTKAGDMRAEQEARGIIYWGVIALFVMVSVWGLVRFIGDAIGVGRGGSVAPPELNVNAVNPRYGEQQGGI